MFLKAVSLVCALVAMASSAAASLAENPFGQCPTFPKVENFDLSRMQGSWYINNQYPRRLSPCQTFNLTLTSPTSMNINSTIRVLKGLELRLNGTIRTADPEVPAFLRWSYTIYPIRVEDVTVVDTDYENYSIVVFCSSYGLLHQKYAVILTRSDEIVDDYLERAQSLLSPYMKFIPAPTFLAVCQLNLDFPRIVTEVKTLDLDSTFGGVVDLLGAVYTSENQEPELFLNMENRDLNPWEFRG